MRRTRASTDTPRHNLLALRLTPYASRGKELCSSPNDLPPRAGSLRRHDGRRRRDHRCRNLHQSPPGRGAPVVGPAGSCRVDRRGRDRRGGGLRFRRAGHALPAGRRRVRVPARGLPSDGRVPLRMGLAPHDPGRGPGRGRDRVRPVRPSVLRRRRGAGHAARRRVDRRRGGGQLCGRQAGEPPLERPGRRQDRGVGDPDRGRPPSEPGRSCAGAYGLRSRGRHGDRRVRHGPGSDPLHLWGLAERQPGGRGDAGAAPHSADRAPGGHRDRDRHLRAGQRRVPDGPHAAGTRSHGHAGSRRRSPGSSGPGPTVWSLPRS